MSERGKLKIVVLVSGRGTNLEAILKASSQGKIKSQVIHVISNKPNVAALERARRFSVPTTVIVSQGIDHKKFFALLLEKLQLLSPDLIVLAGFMKILPKTIVQRFKNKIINIHPALLPKFPGLHAQRQALEAKEKNSGCSAHYVDEGCDTGPIILQNKLSILPHDTEETLSNRLLPLEHETLIKAIQLIEGRS